MRYNLSAMLHMGRIQCSTRKPISCVFSCAKGFIFPHFFTPRPHVQASSETHLQGLEPIRERAMTRDPPRLAARLLAAAVLISLGERAEGLNCSSVYEWQAWSTDLSCGSSLISSIDFAHYGTPRGPDDDSRCDHTADPACDLDVSSFFAGCMWRHSCSVPSNGATFNTDPCPNVGKRTVVKYSCTVAPPASPAPPSPPPSPPASPPPPPEPPGSPSCALLPPLGEQALAADAPASKKTKITFVSVRSLKNLSAAAPNADPFDCVPSICRTSAMSPEECARAAAKHGHEKDWDGVSYTSCGADFKGWRLDWGDIVIGIPVHQAFLERIDQQARAVAVAIYACRFAPLDCATNRGCVGALSLSQVGMGGGAPGHHQARQSAPADSERPGWRDLRAAFDLSGVWWNVNGFRKVHPESH